MDPHLVLGLATAFLSTAINVIYLVDWPMKVKTPTIIFPETMTWMSPETKGPVPLPRSLHTANIIGNRMYVFGGWIPHNPQDDTSLQDSQWKCTNSFSYLDLDTREWTILMSDCLEDKKNWPRPRAGHCAVTIGKRLYIWSGRDGYRKAWNYQVCCKDLWYIDLEKPPAPSQVQLIRATTNSFHLKWNEIPTVEGYLLQLNPESSSLSNPGTPAPISEISALNSQGNIAPVVHTSPLHVLQNNDSRDSPGFGVDHSDLKSNSSQANQVENPTDQEVDTKITVSENHALSGATVEILGKSQTSPETKLMEKCTPPSKPPLPLSTTSHLKATAKNGNKLWCDVGIFQTNTAAVTHFFLLSEGKQATSNKDCDQDISDVTLLKKHDLLPGSAYRFRVAAINGLGIGPFSKISEFKTCIPGFPGAPSSVKVTKTADCIHLSWETPSSPTGNILEYSAYLAIRTTQLPEALNQLVFMKIYCGLQTACTVTAAQLANAHVDCTSRPAVVFRISAKNEKGYGPATQVRWLQDSSKNKKETKNTEKQSVTTSQSRENMRLKMENP